MKKLDPRLNELLVNWYRDGSDYIGPHSDDERELVKGAGIYCISYGATRDFVLCKKKDKKVKVKV